MGTQIILFFLATILIPVIDYVWIGKIMQSFYLSELGSLARTEAGQFKPQLLPALMVYLLLALGILCFVLSWVTSWSQAFGWGALLGFVVYGVYDMTNMSVLQNYGLKLAVADTAWGTLLCGIVSVITFLVKEKLG